MFGHLKIKTLPKQVPVLFYGGNRLISLILALNPLLYFPMNELSGVVANNLGTLGAAANGAYSGVTLAQIAAPGGGLAPKWDGINDTLNFYSAVLAANYNGNGGTILIWVKPHNISEWTVAATRQWIRLDADVNNANGLRKANINTIHHAHVGGGVSTAVYNVITPFDSWALMSITYDDTANQTVCYFNGSQIGGTLSPVGTWVGAPAVNSCHIGSTGSGSYWNGYLAHGAVFNTVLTPAKIAEIYTAGLL